MTLPVLAFIARSGTGKTTLLQQVIPQLRARGIRPGVIKHTHHHMDIDTPGKDSYQLRKSGADQVMVASQQRWALMTETPDMPLSLAEMVSRFDHRSLDLVLVEGFKTEAVAKIVLWREGIEGSLADLTDDYTVAVATDIPLKTNLPLLDINQPEQITTFIITWLTRQGS